MNNLKVEYNENIINKFKEFDIPVDLLGSVLFILFALYEKRYDLLDLFDDSNRERRAIVLYRQMVRKELLEDGEETLYNLSSIGLELVKFIKNEFSNNEMQINAEMLLPVQEKKEKESIKDWISQYIEIFPKTHRNHWKAVGDRMSEFIETYPMYGKEEIIGGTKLYMKERNQKDDHTYTRRSIYFISYGAGRSKVSDLATWCEKYLESLTENKLDNSILDFV